MRTGFQSSAFNRCPPVGTAMKSAISTELSFTRGKCIVPSSSCTSCLRGSSLIAFNRQGTKVTKDLKLRLKRFSQTLNVTLQRAAEGGQIGAVHDEIAAGL